MIKTRFAPSPTGYLHVGGLRTALYCYLFAKKNKGKFVLRIEDTDQERFVEGATENLIKTMKWCGMDYDEGPHADASETGDCGPYIQSKRTDLYKKYADELMEKGRAYRCFCSKERLDEMREAQTKNKQAPMYDRKCCDLPESEIQKKLDAGKPFVIRQKIPYELIKFKDLIRGNVQFHGKTIDDQVLVKSDGFPTYHLANVVDDHLMKITHVIRGEEWLPSTPKHIALYQAFGWEIPEFAHLPLLLNPDKTKLSKRQGHVAVEEYINEGYLREAILNFVAFLGWNPGSGEEKEIFSLEDLEELFSIEKVHKAGAVFNLEKLDWFNWQWRRKKFEDEVDNDQEKRHQKLYELCKQHLTEGQMQNEELLKKALFTVQEKILQNPKEASAHIDFYFKLPHYEKELLTHEKMKVDLNQAKVSIEESKKSLENLEKWTEETIKESLTQIVEKLEVKNGQVFWPIRAALSGLQFSPGVFEIAFVLGKEETINRLNHAIKKTT
ncbi:glutamate--tRNA ligase [Patescibacteria group bacterium]|nr:glutamate--tRNA ligase [Patescibacteria group bacterium]